MFKIKIKNCLKYKIIIISTEKNYKNFCGFKWFCSSKNIIILFKIENNQNNKKITVPWSQMFSVQTIITLLLPSSLSFIMIDSIILLLLFFPKDNYSKKRWYLANWNFCDSNDSISPLIRILDALLWIPNISTTRYGCVNTRIENHYR